MWGDHLHSVQRLQREGEEGVLLGDPAPGGELSGEDKGLGPGAPLHLLSRGRNPFTRGVLSPLSLAGVRLGLGSAPQTARDPTWDSTKKDVLGKGKCGILWVGDLSPSILRGFSFQTGV